MCRWSHFASKDCFDYIVTQLPLHGQVDISESEGQKGCEECGKNFKDEFGLKVILLKIILTI